MPKAVSLTPELVDAPQATPQASTPARVAAKPAAISDQVPLQLKLPRQEVRAIKIAAAERDMSLRDFMLACFHAFMKDGPAAR